jgi:enamine deaminase RidA (YjgF/YER057c/UK114 family)
MNAIEERLKTLGIELPTAMKPVANYVPWVKSGNMVYISGQGPIFNGKIQCAGKLGHSVTLEEGVAAARLTGINIIAQLREAAEGDLSRVKRIVKLVGFVSCVPDFTDHPKVINGASDLMVEIFGDRGRHARSAVGVASLPLDFAVEIEAVAELE